VTDASNEIDAKLTAIGDWRGETLSRLRAVIRAADPQIVETIKWRKASNPSGVPVWEREGIVCTGEIYKARVKLTFFSGGRLPDPTGLFNLDDAGATRRAIDLSEGQEFDPGALTDLVRAAVAHNLGDPN
jgi:hypothetical protein